MAYFATTGIAWGEPAPRCVHLPVTLPREAVAVVRAGGCAWLPDEELARETMRLLGNDEALINERIHFAKTGALLSAGTD